MKCTPTKIAGLACCLGIVLLPAADRLRAAEIELFDGTLVKGIATLRAGGNLTVKTGKDERALPLDQVFEIRFAATAGDGAHSDHLARVSLAGGSHVVGRLLPAMNFGLISLQHPGGSTLRVKGGQVCGIVFGALRAGAREGKTPTPPYVVMRTGKVIAGTPTWLTYLEIALVTPAGQIRLRQDQVHRVCMRAPPHATGTGDGAVRVKTLPGDTFIGRLARLDPEILELQCTWGTIRLPTRLLLTISPVSKRVVNLVDLKPTAVLETPFFSLVRHYQVNRNLFGGTLLLRSRRFDLGLALHSRTRLTYLLGNRYARLVADLGMDTSLTDKGDGVFTLIADGKNLRSVRITGKKKPVRFAVALQGVNKLELLWDFGEGGSSGDHLVIGEPRLIRKQ